MEPNGKMRPIPLAIACVLALAAAPARAQPVAQPPVLNANLAGFHGDPDELPHAIIILEHGGGRVTEIRFNSLAGHPAFDAVVERGGVVHFLRLAQDSSQFRVLARAERPEWMLDWRARAELAYAKAAYVGLASAVRRAETDSRGEAAAAAGVATLASNPIKYAPVYNVLLVRHVDELHRAAVDARTGLIVGDLSPLAPWPRP